MIEWIHPLWGYVGGFVNQLYNFKFRIGIVKQWASSGVVPEAERDDVHLLEMQDQAKASLDVIQNPRLHCLTKTNRELQQGLFKAALL